MTSFRSFEELDVWKESRKLRIYNSQKVQSFPAHEKYRLTDQLIRSTRSVTANIAEGFGWFHHQENIQFCRIARGSLYETLDHLICALDEGYIVKEEYQKIEVMIKVCIKILNGYISYLKQARNKTTNE